MEAVQAIHIMAVLVMVNAKWLLVDIQDKLPFLPLLFTKSRLWPNTMKNLNTYVVLFGLLIASAGCQSEVATTSHEENPVPFSAQKYMPINLEPLGRAGLLEQQDIPRVMAASRASFRPVMELLLQEEVSIEELQIAAVNALDSDHPPAVRAYLEQRIAVNVLDHARDHEKPLTPEQAGYFADLLLKNENANAHLIVYALNYIEDYWSDDRVASSAAKAIDFAEYWASSQGGLHKTAPVDKHEEDDAHVVGLGGAQANQIQALETAIEQLREM